MKMVVGIMTVELYLPGKTSLKEKRRTLLSLKATLKNKYNISVSETRHQDLWQRAELGIAAVSTDRVFIEKETESILRFIERRSDVDLIDQTVEYIH